MRIVLTLFFIALLGACALSPQFIALKPSLEVPVSTVGQGRDMNVRAVDNRSNSVIGTRGGVYGNTSTIEIDNDFKKELAYTVAGALTRSGFRVAVDGYRGHALEFLVSLDQLSYTPDRSVVGKIMIAASVSVQVENGSETYRGAYSANGQMAYVTAPSASKNEKEINKVLSLALQEIFKDEGLMSFMKQ